MSVITRLIQLTRAATGELLDKLEDPAMMMNHYVREAQAEIEKIQQELTKQEAVLESFSSSRMKPLSSQS